MILIKSTERMEKEMSRIEASQCCTYCNGDGYFQLLLGGSETCVHCGGKGGWTHTGFNRENKESQIDHVQLRPLQKLF